MGIAVENMTDNMVRVVLSSDYPHGIQGTSAIYMTREDFNCSSYYYKIDDSLQPRQYLKVSDLLIDPEDELSNLIREELNFLVLTNPKCQADALNDPSGFTAVAHLTMSDLPVITGRVGISSSTSRGYEKKRMLTTLLENPSEFNIDSTEHSINTVCLISCLSVPQFNYFYARGGEFFSTLANIVSDVSSHSEDLGENMRLMKNALMKPSTVLHDIEVLSLMLRMDGHLRDTDNDVTGVDNIDALRDSRYSRMYDPTVVSTSYRHINHKLLEVLQKKVSSVEEFNAYTDLIPVNNFSKDQIREVFTSLDSSHQLVNHCMINRRYDDVRHALVSEYFNNLHSSASPDDVWFLSVLMCAPHQVLQDVTHVDDESLQGWSRILRESMTATSLLGIGESFRDIQVAGAVLHENAGGDTHGVAQGFNTITTIFSRMPYNIHAIYPILAYGHFLDIDTISSLCGSHYRIGPTIYSKTSQEPITIGGVVEQNYGLHDAFVLLGKTSQSYRYGGIRNIVKTFLTQNPNRIIPYHKEY